MMRDISLLLHLHQPPTQFPEVTKKIFEESYEPILSLLKRNPNVRLTINITASLTEQLYLQGFRGWLDDLGSLVKEGRVELTGTASYHPILPKLPDNEITRQILLNKTINTKYFRKAFQPIGFFPPEMAIDSKSLSVIDSLGYEWVSVDETAVPSFPRTSFENKCLSGLVVNITGKRVKLVVRDRELSLKIAFGEIDNISDLNNYLEKKNNSEKYRYFLALDGETFGHHRPSALVFLQSLFEESGRSYSLRTTSETILGCQPVTVQDVARSTWGKGWEIWDNPKNEIHRKQWLLTQLAIDTVNNSPYSVSDISTDRSKISVANKDALPSRWAEARVILDKSLQSDQFWWASGDPNWHYEMVKKGADGLLASIKAVPELDKNVILRAEKLYSEVIEIGIKKFGTGVVL